MVSYFASSPCFCLMDNKTSPNQILVFLVAPKSEHDCFMDQASQSLQLPIQNFSHGNKSHEMAQAATSHDLGTDTMALWVKFLQKAAECQSWGSPSGQCGLGWFPMPPVCYREFTWLSTTLWSDQNRNRFHLGWNLDILITNTELAWESTSSFSSPSC